MTFSINRVGVGIMSPLNVYKYIIMEDLIKNYYGASDFVPVAVDHSAGDPFVQSVEELTSFADVAFPVDEKTGIRINDIDAANMCKDPDLKNILFKNLSPVPDSSVIDTSGMTDDEIADTAIPNNLQLGDVMDAQNSLLDSINNSVDDVVEDVAPLTDSSVQWGGIDRVF